MTTNFTDGRQQEGDPCQFSTSSSLQGSTSNATTVELTKTTAQQTRARTEGGKPHNKKKKKGPRVYQKKGEDDCKSTLQGAAQQRRGVGQNAKKGVKDTRLQ